LIGMAVVRQTYLKATYLLAKNSPAAWADFVEAFKLYTTYELERSLTTMTSEAQVALGMSRRMIELRDDFIHIEERGGKLR
jgi:hypothetical protein